MDDLVRIYASGDAFAAELMKGRLEAEGISVLDKGAVDATAYPTGASYLWVSAEDEARAKAIVDAVESGAFAVTDEDVLEGAAAGRSGVVRRLARRHRPQRCSGLRPQRSRRWSSIVNPAKSPNADGRRVGERGPGGGAGWTPEGSLDPPLLRRAEDDDRSADRERIQGPAAAGGGGAFAVDRSRTASIDSKVQPLPKMEGRGAFQG